MNDQLAVSSTPDMLMLRVSRAPKRKVAGRPRIRQVIVDCILKMAKENPGWGYVRIQGALANLGYKICQSTVANVLKEHGIEPAPDRRQFTNWRTFLKAHWPVLAAIDFTSVEVWTTRGLLTFYLLFVIDLKSRKVHLAGCTVNPNGSWVKQVARNLTDCDEGFLREHEFLIMDRDTKFTQEFRSTLESADVKPIVLPPYSPNLNAYMERFFRCLKSECLSRMIFFGERSLRNAVKEYLEYYHQERNHQGLDNRLIAQVDRDGETNRASPTAPVQCRERLGGMLRYYHRAA